MFGKKETFTYFSFNLVFSSKWMVSGLGDEMIRDQIYRHPDSPADGAVLEAQIVSFERIKLTNNDSPKYGQVRCENMSKCKFVLTVKICQNVDLY